MVAEEQGPSPPRLRRRCGVTLITDWAIGYLISMQGRPADVQWMRWMLWMLCMLWMMWMLWTVDAVDAVDTVEAVDV